MIGHSSRASHLSQNALECEPVRHLMVMAAANFFRRMLVRFDHRHGNVVSNHITNPLASGTESRPPAKPARLPLPSRKRDDIRQHSAGVCVWQCVRSILVH